MRISKFVHVRENNIADLFTNYFFLFYVREEMNSVLYEKLVFASKTT